MSSSVTTETNTVIEPDERDELWQQFWSNLTAECNSERMLNNENRPTIAKVLTKVKWHVTCSTQGDDHIFFATGWT